MCAVERPPCLGGPAAGAAERVERGAVGDRELGIRRPAEVGNGQLRHSQVGGRNLGASARERLASDPKLPANIRDEVLKSLDEEIAKLSKAG